MKNFYIILFSLLISLTASAQVKTTNYNSKWFLGFNTGATWSCDDVNNIWKWRSNENYYELDNDNYGRTIPFGWGLTLGKSFNYDYGRIFSFDYVDVTYMEDGMVKTKHGFYFYGKL